MNKAVFLDRDGVINNNDKHYYIYRKEDFEFNDGIIELMQKWQKDGYLLLIISNQSGIAKGEYTKQDVDKLHEYLKSELKKQGITITKIYYCPHHPDYSNCICRKPDSYLLEKAIARFEINRELSCFIGDSERDILAAQKAGLKGIKTEPNNLNITKLLNDV